MPTTFTMRFPQPNSQSPTKEKYAMEEFERGHFSTEMCSKTQGILCVFPVGFINNSTIVF
jgi:hypothetical protein